MLIVIDIGNTRTKWAQVTDSGLGVVQAAMNTRLEKSPLKKLLLKANKVLVANVAGESIALQLKAMIPKTTEVIFAAVQPEACRVTCGYDESSLGIDRWASVIAAWNQYKQPILVINAGTAITVDALSRDKVTKKGTYLGGSIMPGLQLMYDSLTENTAKLPTVLTGVYSTFPGNTQEAIYSGCINAIVGSVVLQLKNLERHCAFLPKVVISGGDAVKIAGALSPQIRRVIIVENLVLQGLALLGEEEV